MKYNLYINVGLIVISLLSLKIISGKKGNSANDLDALLHHYDVLPLSSVSHRLVKRSAPHKSNHPEVRQIQFQSLGRNFHLYLTKRAKVVSPGFSVVSVDKHNIEEKVDYKPDNFYHGIEFGDQYNSEVNAYYEEDGTLSARIRTNNMTYYIEPSYGRVPHDKTSMIAYKEDDVKMDQDVGSSYCGFVHGDQDEAAYETVDHDIEQEIWGKEHGREKREAKTSVSKTKCPVMLVADFRFYREVGQESVSTTASYLIGLIDRVDTLYRNTDFGHGFRGMGFEIKQIRIHKEPTAAYDGKGKSEPHYNQDGVTWLPRPLLEKFSLFSQSGAVCMSHLFTYQSFDGGILGLAYIASPRLYTPGGVCAAAYEKDGTEMYLNTGWSTSLNRHGRRLLTSEADLVTAHEFGHNWGSEHDPPSDECSPHSSNGGKHLMYTYAVSGYENNNKLFSECSKRSIAAVLFAKHQDCFKEPEDAYCGNSLVEPGEECDVGPEAHVTSNPCCDKNCKLKPGAVCSDLNHACCSLCQYSLKNTICHTAQNDSCEESAYCNGWSKFCPEPKPKSDGVTCHNGGKCKDGSCQSFCETRDLISCICDQVNSSCLHCCKSEENGNCTIYDEKSKHYLPEGTPCLVGYCEKGECVKEVQELVERLWDIIENLNPSTFVAMMRANIVGSVIIFSLALWIPAACIISRIDRRKRQQEQEDFANYMANRGAAVIPEDSALVRSARWPKTPQPSPLVRRVTDNNTFH